MPGAFSNDELLSAAAQPHRTDIRQAARIGFLRTKMKNFANPGLNSDKKIR
jgi:hypothetical protein